MDLDKSTDIARVISWLRAIADQLELGGPWTLPDRRVTDIRAKLAAARDTLRHIARLGTDMSRNGLLNTMTSQAHVLDDACVALSEYEAIGHSLIKELTDREKRIAFLESSSVALDVAARSWWPIPAFRGFSLCELLARAITLPVRLLPAKRSVRVKVQAPNKE